MSRFYYYYNKIYFNKLKYLIQIARQRIIVSSCFNLGNSFIVFLKLLLNSVMP